MAPILLVGPDAPLLEGLAQTLAAVGHRPRMALSIAEALEHAAATTPMVAVLDRAQALAGSDGLRIPLVPGGMLVLYRLSGEATDPLPPSLQRLVLADLTLPLERNRLVALVQHVEERLRETGRGKMQTPPEHRAI
jgi:DNA-binding NtrC family response regulator